MKLLILEEESLLPLHEPKRVGSIHLQDTLQPKPASLLPPAAKGGLEQGQK